MTATERIATRLLLTLAAWGILPSLLGAQVVRGTLTEVGTGDPIEGAFVRLVDQAGEARGSTLTDPSGGFLLRAPASGTYRVVAERIGYGTVESDPLDLQEETTRRLEMTVQATAVELEGLSVEAERRCRVRPEDGGHLERLWDEVRKALAVAEWTEDAGILRYRTRLYGRTLDIEEGTVRGEESRERTGWGSHPFVSRDPEQLARNGYVQADEEGRFLYFAPDAATLLSDSFLETHCFRIAEGEPGSGQVGLAFGPHQERELPDIEGVLWVDRESAELDRLTFRYVGLEGPRNSDRLGGRVEFERLPTGAWVVSRWWIRMPVLGSSRAWWLESGSKGREVLARIREVGGEILELETVGGTGGIAPDRAVVEGIAWDSTRAAPLPGARVYLSGTSHSTRADSSGVFVLDDLPEGRYTLAFHHPRLDTLGVFVPGREVELTGGVRREIDVAVPSRERLARIACREETEEGGGEGQAGGVVAGTVRDRLTDAPVPGARVRVVPGTGGGGGEGASPTAPPETGDGWETETDAQGRYRICSVPPGRVRVTASFLEREGEAAPPISLAEGEARIVDLALSLTEATRVVVEVVEHGSGRPVSGASVRIGADGPVLVTDAQGRVVQEEVSPGLHRVQVDALAHGTVADSVLVRPAETVRVRVPVAIEAVELSGFTVTAEGRASRGIGMMGSPSARGTRADILDWDEIREVLPRTIDTADLLRRLQAPGFRVQEVHTPEGVRELCAEVGRVRTGLHGEECEMVEVYLDDVRLSDPGANLLNAIDPEQIQRIELLSPAEAGAIYGTGSRRGVLLIYTRDGRP